MPQIDGVEHEWLDVGGHRLHVAIAGSGPPVVLVHGFPEHWYAWRHLIPALAVHHRVIAPDLRGFGWSDAPGGAYAKEQYADDVIALIERIDLGPVGLVGHDWGGVASYFVCLRRPELVSRYLALGTAHPWAPQDARTLLETWRFWYAWVIAAPLVGDAVLRRSPAFVRTLLKTWSAVEDAWSPEELDGFAAQFAEPERAAAGVATYRTYLTRELAARPYAQTRLTTPTLHLHGAQDACVAPALVRGWRAHADDMRLELIEGCGHFPAEERPDVVRRRALEFLSG